jgi:hypothetical protein
MWRRHCNGSYPHCLITILICPILIIQICHWRRFSVAKRVALVERFWARVRKTYGCWLWQGGCYKHPRTGEPSYGCVWTGDKKAGTGRMRAAHIVSWEMAFGPVPLGMKVCHSCDNPACVRPDHLFLGTQGDNVADMMAKGRKRPARGSQQGSALLSEDQVAELLQGYRRNTRGERRAWAVRLGVSPDTITSIVGGKGWNHVRGLGKTPAA